MANPGDLRLAAIQIGRDDTGAGGLVPLTADPDNPSGKAQPIVRFGDPGWENPPIVVVHTPDTPRWGGTPAGWEVRATFQVLVPQTAAEGLEHTIADRLASRMTSAAFGAKGVDTTARETARRDATELARGLVRLDCDYLFTMSV